MMYAPQGDCRFIAIEQMTPTQERPGAGKRGLILAQHRVLNESLVVLLLDRYEHTHDIADQVCTAFWHAIQEYGLGQRPLHKFPVALV
jgi:hypothetical protein